MGTLQATKSNEKNLECGVFATVKQSLGEEELKSVKLRCGRQGQRIVIAG